MGVNDNVGKTVKNSMISVLAQVCLMLLNFVTRRVFVIFLDLEYLGYHSLFTNVFSILSIAELGIGPIISFHLYKHVIGRNTEEIGRLMYFYKWVYRAVALIVAVLGIGCSFFLPYIVKDSTVTGTYLYTIYFIQLSSVVMGYFLSYRRNILYVTQQEYKCVYIDLAVNIAVQIIQLLTLWLFGNYILYLALQVSTTVISNFVIKIVTDKNYPYLKENYSISKEYIKENNFIPDVKNFLVHRIAYAVFGGTDNILISAFCGVRVVAQYGNYVLIKNGVLDMLFYKLLNPVQATLGNIVYSKRSKDDLWDQFETLDLFGFFLALYISMGFLVFYQPAITVWMGAENLLPISFVILFSISVYYGSVWEIVYKYRSLFGEFDKDRDLMILSAVLNILISIPGAKLMGVTGIQFGTFISFFPIAYGRIRFVVKNYFERSVGRYLLKHLYYTAIMLVSGTACYFITAEIPVSAAGFLFRGIVWLIVPGAAGVLFTFRSRYFANLVDYIKSAVNAVAGIKKNNNNDTSGR